MMLCYEGLIGVLLEIISNDFFVHALCVFARVFVELYLASMDLVTSSYLPHGVWMKVLENMYKLQRHYQADDIVNDHFNLCE